MPPFLSLCRYLFTHLYINPYFIDTQRNKVILGNIDGKYRGNERGIIRGPISYGYKKETATEMVAEI